MTVRCHSESLKKQCVDGARTSIFHPYSISPCTLLYKALVKNSSHLCSRKMNSHWKMCRGEFVNKMGNEEPVLGGKIRRVELVWLSEINSESGI